MAYFTVNGNAYPIAYDGNQQQTSVTIGEATRAFSGAGRSTLQKVKREWTMNTTEIDDTTLAALEADILTNNMLPLCGGDLFQGGTNVPCIVTVVSWTDVYDNGVGGIIHKQIVTINVREA